MFRILLPCGRRRVGPWITVITVAFAVASSGMVDSRKGGAGRGTMVDRKPRDGTICGARMGNTQNTKRKSRAAWLVTNHSLVVWLASLVGRPVGCLRVCQGRGLLDQMLLEGRREGNSDGSFRDGQ